MKKTSKKNALYTVCITVPIEDFAVVDLEIDASSEGEAIQKAIKIVKKSRRKGGQSLFWESTRCRQPVQDTIDFKWDDLSIEDIYIDDSMDYFERKLGK